MGNPENLHGTFCSLTGGLKLPAAMMGLILLAALGLIACGSSAPPPPPPKAPETGQTQAKMERFHLTEVQDGVKRWVLEADKADFLKDRMEIQISGIHVEFSGYAGGPLHLSCQEGLVNTQSRVLTLRGQVQLEAGDLRLTTNLLTYQPKERAIVAPEEVMVEGPRLTIKGKGLHLDLVNRKIQLSEHQGTQVKIGKGGLPL